mmetsp:Transcript_16068/g.51270  ORF Transcript_16068/g.51270 Transcript_16068/m.51270 type:complete len:221 (+) Transcript_16068:649-1311(+)
MVRSLRDSVSARSSDISSCSCNSSAPRCGREPRRLASEPVGGFRDGCSKSDPPRPAWAGSDRMASTAWASLDSSAALRISSWSRREATLSSAWLLVASSEARISLRISSPSPLSLVSVALPRASSRSNRLAKSSTFSSTRRRTTSTLSFCLSSNCSMALRRALATSIALVARRLTVSKPSSKRSRRCLSAVVASAASRRRVSPTLSANLRARSRLASLSS